MPQHVPQALRSPPRLRAWGVCWADCWGCGVGVGAGAQCLLGLVGPGGGGGGRCALRGFSAAPRDGVPRLSTVLCSAFEGSAMRTKSGGRLS